MASSVRIASVTLTMWRRLANLWSVTSAARCCSAVILPESRARRTARVLGNRESGCDPGSGLRLSRPHPPRALPQAARSLRCSASQVQPQTNGRGAYVAAELPYASPRSLSIRAAAVPGGSRISGQSSKGSPSSTAGVITPDATSRSN